VPISFPAASSDAYVHRPVDNHASWLQRERFAYQLNHSLSASADVVALKDRLNHASRNDPSMRAAFYFPYNVVLTSRGFKHGVWHGNWGWSYPSHERTTASNLTEITSCSDAERAIKERARELVANQSKTDIGYAGMESGVVRKARTKKYLRAVARLVTAPLWGPVWLANKFAKG